MWNIPNTGEAQNDIQSILFKEYLDVLVAGINGLDCVLNGGAVTAQGSPDMTVAVAKAGVLSNGILKAYAGGNGTITTANATNPRIDLVVITSSGTLAVRAGTPASTPKPPTRTANDVVLAAVYVPATDTTISSDQIVDMRVMRTLGPITIFKDTVNNTGVPGNTRQVMEIVTIPNGLFLSGRVLRIRFEGTYLSNSGSPTLTLDLTFGGTTIFKDVTAAFTADVDNGAWMIELDIVAYADTNQNMNGFIMVQTPGAKTAATNGLGDLAVLTSVITPIAGSSSIDCNAANVDVSMGMLWSVNNASDALAVKLATVELL